MMPARVLASGLKPCGGNNLYDKQCNSQKMPIKYNTYIGNFEVKYDKMHDK